MTFGGKISFCDKEIVTASILKVRWMLCSQINGSIPSLERKDNN